MKDTKGFFGKPIGHTKDDKIVLYDEITGEYGIDELFWVREPNPSEMEDIRKLKTGNDGENGTGRQEKGRV